MPQSDFAPRQAMRQLRAMKRLYDGFRQGRIRAVNPDLNQPFCPRMEIFNDSESPDVIATFELPGVEAADLSISAKEGVLWIRGKRQPRYRRHQRSVRGQPQAAVADDMDVDSAAASEAGYFRYTNSATGRFVDSSVYPPISRITASLSDGLLTVTWPRPLVGQTQLDGTIIVVHSVPKRRTKTHYIPDYDNDKDIGPP
ncbi:hypothetical protein DFH06DRAFT_1149166 [Mycena polygramma]|nr:hypothetical protein DFH06DRAFT_1149166 [Mycena polygramma]